jgi:hypothetical protein
VIFCLRTMILCATTLAVLLVIDGPVVKAEEIMQVLCSRGDRNLKSITQLTRVDVDSMVMLKSKC